MSEQLYRLVYTSTNKIEGSPEQIKEEVQQILRIARCSNEHNGITGALMFNAGCFAQVLEGTHDNVQLTFERIQCDERHADVVILDFSPVDSRGFKEWSMAYVGEHIPSMKEFAEIAQTSHFDPNRVSAQPIYEVLQKHLAEVEILAALKKAS